MEQEGVLGSSLHLAGYEARGFLRRRHDRGVARKAGGQWIALLCLIALAPESARAQAHPDPDAPAGPPAWAFGAHAVALATYVSPALDGRSLTEGYLAQPALSAHGSLWDGRVALLGMVNLEGVTLQRGELNPGIWGEGYVDRRHPHTLLHELMATVRVPVGPGEASVALGKGFAPFGTDDPGVRPFAKFPANHHFAQVLERLVLIGAMRRGPVSVEAALFNGDEPSSAWEHPSVRRFGDSWSARAILFPLPGLELQASYAAVESPEVRVGGGLDQRKWSGSARWEAAVRDDLRVYGLVEWARTDDYNERRRSFSFRSALAEASVLHRRAELALRLERTVRPEEERLEDPFRSPRPHGDANILGMTRWDILTVSFASQVGVSGWGRASPFAEAAWHRATPVHPSALFVPSEFYGSDRIWSLSAGVRLQTGAIHGRMGRYGVATGASVPAAPEDRHH